MRIITYDKDHFYGTHKGATINIEREAPGRFYIIVQHNDGGYLYDGWAPEGITNMREAKIEAIRGAEL